MVSVPQIQEFLNSTISPSSCLLTRADSEGGENRTLSVNTTGLRPAPALQLRRALAPPVGLEPTTSRLTAERSAIELRRNKSGGNVEEPPDIDPGPVSEMIPQVLIFRNRYQKAFCIPHERRSAPCRPDPHLTMMIETCSRHCW